MNYSKISSKGKMEKKRKKLPEQDTVVLLLKAFFDLESRVDQIPFTLDQFDDFHNLPQKLKQREQQ
jgi:hypothetical protein